MLQLKIISLAVCLHALIGASRGADKYTDENRPYEFGFKIDGEQHRHEKKDENGIIMGEFGFITADGVYHVTVYATDENGRFKILSMKNIRVKPYPGSGGSMKKGHSLPFPSSGNVPTLQDPSKTSTSNQESKSTQTEKQISSPAKACSHCRLPTTTTKAPELTDIAVVARDHTVTSGLLNSDSYQSNPSSGSNRPDSYGQHIITPSGLGAQNTQSSISQNNSPHRHQPILSGQENHPKQEHDIGRSYQKQGSAVNQLPLSYTNDYYPQQGTNSNLNNPQGNDGTSYYNKNENGPNQNIPQIVNSDVQAYTQNINNNLNQNYPQTENDAYQKYPQQQIEPNNYYSQPGSSFDQQLPRQEVPESNSQARQGTLRVPKQYSNNNPSNSGLLQSPGFEAALASQGNQPISNKPTLLAAQMQIVPKDTDIYHKSPGEKDGLPGGLSKNDMTQLLYTFNYTVGFHGHHEEGYTNGAKQGYYFVTGRNGIRTRVDYIADEKGFRPRISHEVLDIASDDVPKPESEKDEKFGLKGYEFKWLYYPAEHRK